MAGVRADERLQVGRQKPKSTQLMQAVVESSSLQPLPLLGHIPNGLGTHQPASARMQLSANCHRDLGDGRSKSG